MERSESATPEGPKKSPFDDLSRDELIIKCKGLLAIAQKAKLAKSELQSTVDTYKEQLEKYEKEKKNNLDNIKTLQELVDSLTEQKLNYITEVESAQTKIKACTAKCVAYEETINSIKADLINRDKSILDTNQKLSDLDIEVTSLKRQNKRLLEENEELLKQLSEFESQICEFNNIGMQQREQLQILEESVKTDEHYKNKIEELTKHVTQLESNVQDDAINYKTKFEEVSQSYENEKCKKEKAYVKLRSYKDKILKCAACIHQLQNSRSVLSRTVKEYSEIIPKWQNDILKASKILENQIFDLSKNNIALKEKLLQVEKELQEVRQNKENYNVNDVYLAELTLKKECDDLQQKLINSTTDNTKLQMELDESKSQQNIIQNKLEIQLDENKSLKEKCNESTKKLFEIQNSIQVLKSENQILNEKVQSKMQDNEVLDRLNLQVKALESEKSILVKEKLNARDSVIELENQSKMLTEELSKTKQYLNEARAEINQIVLEKKTLETNIKEEKEGEINILKCKLRAQQEQFNLLKKEHDDIQDLNNLLKEEVETLKFSLEQPKDDTESQSDLNDSLQADIVKLETKLGAYKQENASLLIEIKELRSKSKEFDALISEYEDAKSKLANYKSENTELLNEMKEINQVLKERGEAISKLQKAVTEMERLVETLEKDRDNTNKDNNDLLKKIKALESDLKDAKQNTNKKSEAAHQINVEYESAMKNLATKDAIIVSLKEEIEKLKQQSSADLPNEDMSTSTISKAEEHARMKDLDETFEEKYSKIRIFALKLKKKLNEATSELQQAVQDKTKLEKLLNDNKSFLPAEHVEIRSNEEDSAENKSQINELEARVISLTDSLQSTNEELKKMKVDLANKEQQLVAELEAHKTTKDNLEKARRDIKKKNVLSLEMEDYERSMNELTVKMEDSKKKIIQMESTIDTQESTITTMKTQIKLLEEQIKTEEKQNKLVKEELQQVIEESKEKENLVQMKNLIIKKLEQDLEAEKRKNEDAVLEMTLVLSEKEKIIMSLGEDKIDLNNKLKKMEFKCAELNEKLRIVNIELADLKTEHASYKVRAQSILRQNQTVDHSQEEQLKEEAAALRAQIETLTMKITTLQEQVNEKTIEVESSRRRIAEATNEVNRAQQRTTRLQADLTRLSQQMESERTQNKLQVTTLTHCYKTQISELETKLQQEIEKFTSQLAAAEHSRKSGKVAVITADTLNRNQYMVPVIPKDESSDGELDINVSMIPREEGEGSESAPSPPPSKPYLGNSSGTRSPVPLDRLLEEGVPDDETMDFSSLALTPEQEISDLKRRLQAQQQRVKHVTVLLSESERESARMAQLAELLKAELKRVRGSTQNAHNTEYMKNVTLKFLTLPPGDERSRLVPVLQKILTLTQDETHKIQAIAKGLDPNPSKGWGSYLPWPGGK